MFLLENNIYKVNVINMIVIYDNRRVVNVLKMNNMKF